MKNNLPISVWLIESKTYLLHCMICGNSLGLKVDGIAKQVVIGQDMSKAFEAQSYKALQFPIRMNCKTKSERHGDCPARYIIQGYIYAQKDED